MFLTEQDRRDTFWANYNYNNRAIKYQFECPLRQGNIDLVTVEKFQEQYQIDAFEFKLDDRSFCRQREMCRIATSPGLSCRRKKGKSF